MKIIIFFTTLAFLLVIASHQEQQNSEQEKVNRKLLATADMLILTANGLTSRQSPEEIEWANELAPLAEYVIKHLGK